MAQRLRARPRLRADRDGQLVGMREAPVTVEDSTGWGMYRVLTEGTKEMYGGKCVEYTGEVLGW